jgi:hypothetical protein
MTQKYVTLASYVVPVWASKTEVHVCCFGFTFRSCDIYGSLCSCVVMHYVFWHMTNDYDHPTIAGDSICVSPVS